jgi:hypothetical protein
MDCVEVADRLLADEPGHDPELDQHVFDCARCAHVVQGLNHLNAVLRSAVVVVPPLELQQRLSELAFEAARPARQPWWRRLGELNLTTFLTQRPQLIAAQGLAAVMLAMASWQNFGWLSAFQPIVGDVTYAMTLVAGSPAVSYLGNLQIDLQSLGLWSLVGIAGWLVSENGVIGRRIASSGLRLP